jgi:hypothetical protein
VRDRADERSRKDYAATVAVLRRRSPKTPVAVTTPITSSIQNEKKDGDNNQVGDHKENPAHGPPRLLARTSSLHKSLHLFGRT